MEEGFVGKKSSKGKIDFEEYMARQRFQRSERKRFFLEIGVIGSFKLLVDVKYVARILERGKNEDLDLFKIFLFSTLFATSIETFQKIIFTNFYKIG